MTSQPCAGSSSANARTTCDEPPRGKNWSALTSRRREAPAQCEGRDARGTQRHENGSIAKQHRAHSLHVPLGDDTALKPSVSVRGRSVTRRGSDAPAQVLPLFLHSCHSCTRAVRGGELPPPAARRQPFAASRPEMRPWPPPEQRLKQWPITRAVVASSGSPAGVELGGHSVRCELDRERAHDVGGCHGWHLPASGPSQTERTGGAPVGRALSDRTWARPRDFRRFNF